MVTQFISSLIAILSFTLTTTASAHGEDKYGPHKGHIRMPGAFHTELVLKDPTSVEIYLLDINFQNPVIEKSTVIVDANLGKESWALTCKSQTATKSFLCQSSKDLTKSKIKVLANRNLQQGNVAEYQLPLPVLKESHKPSNSHHHH